MRRVLTWKSLLIVAGLLLTILLIIEFHTAVVLFRALWHRVLWAGRWVGVFGRRFMIRIARRLMLKQLIKPILTLLGVTWLTRFLVKHFGAYVAPKLRVARLRIARSWYHVPWYLKACLLVAAVVLAVSLGIGLWVIPVGIPFAGKVLVKLQLMLADSWMMKRTRAIRLRAHHWTRARRDHAPIRAFRGVRYWIIMRHRTWDARATRALAAILHR